MICSPDSDPDPAGSPWRPKFWAGSRRGISGTFFARKTRCIPKRRSGTGLFLDDSGRDTQTGPPVPEDLPGSERGSGFFRHHLPVLTEEAKQDKNRMQPLVPLNPMLIPHLTDLIQNKNGDEPIFDITKLTRWLQVYHIPLHKTKGHLVLMDTRKLFEQKSDELGVCG